MKNTILILMSLILSIPAMSQDYESIFGTESTQWNITIGNLWGMGTAEYLVVGDTVINDLHYRVVVDYSDNFQGFLREDSTHSKAWYLSNFDNSEYLIMDLNLEVGDSMFIGGAWNSAHQYYYVDSVFSKNGRKHIRFDFEIHFLDNEKFTLIEGITSNLGFRFQDNEFVNSFPTILLCAFKNGIQIYGTGDCIISSAVEDFETVPVEIFPNPFKDEINIKYSGISEMLTVSIYDLNGRIVHSGKIQNPDRNTFNLKNFSPGFYLVLIQDEKGNFSHSAKLLKSD